MKSLRNRIDRVILGIALLAVFVGGVYSFRASDFLSTEEDLNKPVSFELTQITAPNCTDCINSDKYLPIFEEVQVKFEAKRSYAYDSSEGKELIRKLGITKVPTIVMEGDVKNEKISQLLVRLGKVKDNYFVFTAINPIYVDPLLNREIGRLSLTAIHNRLCTDCQNTDYTLSTLASNLNISNKEDYDLSEPQAQELIRKYNIKVLPTVILSEDFRFYSQGSRAINIGTYESDGTFVLRTPPAPYWDLENSKVVGLVEAIYLKDNSCSDCADTESKLFDLLERSYTIKIKHKRVVDVSSQDGKELVQKYQLSKVPLVVLSSEVNEYKYRLDALRTVGKFAEDGTYYLSELDQIKGVTYKDLSSGNIVKQEE